MSAWREKYKVHPAADVFPMMSDEELAELGADIKNRGVIEPVKFRGDWLLDGRNRLEAAERAGVDIGPPAHLPGVDPVSYVISANLHRRHLSKQARAELIVALAKLDQVDPYPEGVAGGRGKTSQSRRERSRSTAPFPLDSG